MRIIVAPDSFKGSASALQVAQAMERGVHAVFPHAEVVKVPIADGGEGTVAALLDATGGSPRTSRVRGPLGEPVEAGWGLLGDGLTAVIEMAAASGLPLVPPGRRDPRLTTTWGTGELVRAALDEGLRRLVLGIGGSATNDGGVGMAAAMGVRFLDASGNEVFDLPADLERVARIERAPASGCEIIVACDVTNPLLGEQGATRVYGPQKGVKDLAYFEERLQKLADLVKRDLGCDHRDEPGAGAAGGLGFGLMSFCGAQMRGGFDLVADITGLRGRIAQADIVITGEGRLDAQSLHGKGPVGVAEMARAAGKRVVGLGGLVESRDELLAKFDAIWQAKPEGLPVAEAIPRAVELLEDCAARHAGAVKVLAGRGSR